jgi:uncharacterized phiE125 gp8 family phage protein
MNPVRITPPASLPVDLDYVKHRTRISHDAEDIVVYQMIRQAVSKMDGYRGILGRAIMPQTWRETFGVWGRMRLALPDVTSATVTYLDEAEVEQTVADAVLCHDARGSYVVAVGPETATAITVTYDCAAPEDILPSIERAVALHVAMDYEDREGGDRDRRDSFQRTFQAAVGHIRWVGP